MEVHEHGDLAGRPPFSEFGTIAIARPLGPAPVPGMPSYRRPGALRIFR